MVRRHEVEVLEVLFSISKIFSTVDSILNFMVGIIQHQLTHQRYRWA